MDDPEATPLRRLIAFALIFFGLFMVANANFASGIILLSPVVILLFVITGGSAAIAIWVDDRIARGILHIGAGIACFAAAAVWAVLTHPADWRTLLVMLLGADGLIAWGAVGLHLIRPMTWFTDFDRLTRLPAYLATLLLVLFVWRQGGGPVLAILMALLFLFVAWLLRPVPAAGEAP